MNNDLNETIKALKYLMEATEEDELIPLSESLCKKILMIIEQMAEKEGAE